MTETKTKAGSDGSGNETTPEFQVVDKRHFVDVESVLPEGSAEDKPRYPSFVEGLMARVAETERRFEEKKVQMQEEIARTKSRLEAEYERRVEHARRQVLLNFLEVMDNLERALEAAVQRGGADPMQEGIEMTARLFRSKLQAEGVEAILLLHQPFDPNVSQAMASVPVSDASQDGIVVDEMVRGYRIGDRLLRPAQVHVGRFSNGQ
jgi:molecular chaperone GrpE